MTLPRLAGLLASALLLAGFVLAGLAAAPAARAQTGADGRPPAAALVDQVRLGGDLYTANCAVCHGATGLGYAEAKTAFPPDHQRCTRCHKRSNPAQQSLDEPFDDHDMFDLGDPPAVVGEDALRAFPNALALHAYIAATMPRYEPGRLSSDEYVSITAWLLDQNARLEGDAPLRSEGLALRGGIR